MNECLDERKPGLSSERYSVLDSMYWYTQQRTRTCFRTNLQTFHVNPQGNIEQWKGWWKQVCSTAQLPAACMPLSRSCANKWCHLLIHTRDQATAQFLFCLLITFPVLCLYHVAYLAVLWWGDKKKTTIALSSNLVFLEQKKWCSKCHRRFYTTI